MSRTLFHRSGVWLLLISLIGLCGCHTRPGGTGDETSIVVRGRVENLTTAQNGSFRYFGDFILQTPARYFGKKVGLFVISHDSDVREFSGKTISFTHTDDGLKRAVEPFPDGFSVSPPEPQLSLECDGAVFRAIDWLNYEKEIAMRGVVRSYEPEKHEGNLYFQYDMAYSGDLASVEVTAPAKYRGVIIHVLVYDPMTGKPSHRNEWSRLGTSVSFSVSESVLAWEPWGFVPVEQLHAVTIDGKP